MDHQMTIRLKASVQTLVFVIMLAATLFGTAGRFDIIEFWVYIAIVAAVSVLSLTILDADLIQERMRPGGRRVGLALSTDHYRHVPALGRGWPRPRTLPSQ
jgi:hypothetical protein